ncbi:diguanylate cyclase domain-containing protein [Silvimonas sp.]|uniref:sensor domain-containing diguanylate cyclase n=1 Tax=Silvimonas sp. TaxID=2650811 RepID=UPI0028439603|nr:diguanylate cyclase [Silvimonas sp.]MDR3429083.1 diguanylate cyclase [Silvimonas sp.]
MSTNINPTDVARETLKQLSIRRISPTPDHYEEIFHSIAGTPEEERLNPLARVLEEKLAQLPRQSPELLRNLDQFRRAIRAGDWERAPELIFKCVDLQGGQAQLTRSWADLLREFMRQWELRNPAYPTSRKQDSLEKVLINFGADPAALNEKLDGLVRSWTETSGGSIDSVDPVEEVLPAGAIAPIMEVAENNPRLANWEEWREALAQALDLGLAARLTHHPDLAIDASSLAREVEGVLTENDLRKFVPRLKKFWIRLELTNGQEERLCDGLLNLLRLLTDNIGEIIVDEEWVHGQIAVVQNIMSQPLDMRLIYDAEAGLKEVIYKQSVLKQGLREAQTSLKSVLTSFIDRLGTIADSTDQYHTRINRYSDQIERSNNLADLKDVLDNLTQDTRSMKLDVVRTRDELLESRAEADAAQARIQQLENELRSVSEKVREDQLTGALNRRGLEESIVIEAARAQRHGSPLALVLLDLDDFKRLNDSRGHSAGDKALIHLVAVVKSLLRPTDRIARYGGEEFVLLLPETSLTEGSAAMLRLQRELTRRFFLHNNEKILITFSAGVTLLQPGEPGNWAIDRADAAMYRAKKAGKNRVEIEHPPAPGATA